MRRKVKAGTLVEVSWLDAVFFCDLSEVTEECLERGGELVHTTGYVISSDEKVIVLVAELDEERSPLRDVNIIPMSLVRNIKVLGKGSFGK